MGKLDGKIALITGGTTGIGRETARVFAAEGATVIATGRNAETIEEAKAIFGTGIEVTRSDASNIDEIKVLVSDIQQRHGRIDVLFANAGMGSMRPMAQVDEEYFDSMIGLNLKGVFFVAQQSAAIMPDGGAIILTSSVAGKIGAPGGSIYAASKAGVRALGRCLAAELAHRNIRVNTLSPGPIETPLMGKSGMPAERIKEMMRAMVPLGRVGHVSEAASAALFLACSDSSFITGTELMVAGGQTDI